MASKISQGINTVASAIITLTVALLFAGNVLPVGLDAIFDANTSAWDAATVTLFLLIALAGVIAVLVAVFNVVQKLLDQ